ncbi:MAG: transcription antitermination factor NusB [Spirochaetes bacterium]|jgi:N utilization substance protein B|nr:transcription antitermination factor NusB [Spirochaetota bacterium]
MGGRRRGRIIAVQSLYRHDLSGAGIDELFDFSWIDGERAAALADETVAFARLLIQGTLENLGAVDAAVRRHLEHWDFSRLQRVDLALMRVSVYCLLFQPDIPASVTIDEAVDIARAFGGADSWRFVNGVLDAVHRETSL